MDRDQQKRQQRQVQPKRDDGDPAKPSRRSVGHPPGTLGIYEGDDSLIHALFRLLRSG